MPDEKQEGEQTEGTEEDADGETAFWAKLDTLLDGKLDSAFDRWIERENAALEAEEKKTGGKTKATESADDGDGGDTAGRQPSDAERQRSAGRVGPRSYWDRAERIIYGRRAR